MLRPLSAWLVLLLLILLGLANWRRLFPIPEPPRPTAPPASAKPPRPLRPRSPDDCPACRNVAHPPSPTRAAPVQPWHKRKSRRGRRKFSVRRHTALYRLKTAAARVALVLTALTEGLSVAGAVHTFGHRERIITTWLRRAGTHTERLHGRLFCNLQLLEVQLDELSAILETAGCGIWDVPPCATKTRKSGSGSPVMVSICTSTP